MLPTQSASHFLPHAARKAALVAAIFASLFMADAAAGQHVEELLTRDVDGFTLMDTDGDSPAVGMGVFFPEDTSIRLHLIVGYGEAAEELKREFVNAMWANRSNVQEVEIDGLTFQSFESGGDVMVMRDEDDRLIYAGGPVPSSLSAEEYREQIVQLLEAWGPSRVVDWTPPPSEG